MRRTLFIVLSVVAVFLLLGISLARLTGPKIGNTFSTISRELPGGYGGGDASEEGMAPMPEAAPALADSASSKGRATRQDLYNSAGAPAQPQERLVIQNVQLSLVVEDPGNRQTEITALAQEFGGYVVSSSMSQVSATTKKVLEATVEIRVPSDRLDEALGKIKEGAVEVTYENRTGQDVTEQYVDLESQLAAKLATEKKLLEIMDKATRTQDVLEVYVQVQNVQMEIERLKGQLKYLKESADLSLINIRLVAEESTQPLTVGPWKPQGTAKEAIEDLIVFFQNFIDFLILLVLNILPKLILIAIPLYLVFLLGRAVYRRVEKKEADLKEARNKETSA